MNETVQLNKEDTVTVSGPDMEPTEFTYTIKELELIDGCTADGASDHVVDIKYTPYYWELTSMERGEAIFKAIFENPPELVAKGILKETDDYLITVIVDDFELYIPFDEDKIKAAKNKETKIVKVKTKKKGKVLVKWEETKDVSGYKIYYSRNKNFKKCETKKVSAKKTSCTIKKLKKGKTYYFKIKPITKVKESEGKIVTVYGKAKNVKKVKVPKK